MSRVQLALNVSEPRRRRRLLLQALRHRAGEGAARATPTSRSPSRRSSWCSSRATATPGSLNHLGVEVETHRRGRRHAGAPAGRGPRHRDRGRGRVLLRGAGQGVGRRPRRRAVGDLHRARRRRDGAGRAADRRARRGRDVLRGGAGVRRALLLIDRRWIVDLARRATAEVVGTAFLVAIVVGSGIAAQRLSPPTSASQLLENSIATGAGLVALILALGPVSGAHFNPIVTHGRPHPRRHHHARRAASTSSCRSSARASARWSPTSCSTCPPSTSRPTRVRQQRPVAR